MPVGSETIIVGQYTATWNSVALGIMEGDAGVPTIYPAIKGQPIDNTDKYGKSRIDGIYLGADWFAAFVAMEYKAGTKGVVWPFATWGQMGVIGRLWYNLAQPLVLTAVSGTPAASSPASLTASKALIDPGAQPRLVYGPSLRTLSCLMTLLPYDSGGSVVWFTET